MFISSLKLTTISAVIRTSTVPLAGIVEVIWGPETSSVVKVHGLGAGPATRALPARSVPPVISNV